MLQNGYLRLVSILYRLRNTQGFRAGACLAITAGLLTLSACGQEASEDPSLDALVIQDPNFSFATSRSVRLQLTPNDAAGEPQALEVRDAEGRRLMKGGFAGSVALDLKVPVGMQQQLTVRQGLGEAVTEQTVNLDSAGKATASY